MGHRDPKGSIVFDAPVSTMEVGSLERNAGDIGLLWPNQGAGAPCSLMSQFRQKEKLQFFCPQEILLHGRTVEVQIDNMGSYAELVLGPRGKAERAFFWE